MSSPATGPQARRAVVLVVDDSAVTREVLRSVLSNAGFEVYTAANSEIALRRVAEHPVGVIVLDLNLPGVSGLELMALFPRPRPPIVICSALAVQDASMALAALEAGAVDVIGKPALGVHEYLEGAAERIVGAVRQALRERGTVPARSSPPAAGAATAPQRSPKRGVHVELIAIGASAGGVEALHCLLPLLPVKLPPVVVVQHMPGAFSEAFARRLDERCELRVQLARDGDRLTPGNVSIAPGGRHLVVTRVGHQLLCRLDGSDPVKRHRPSVDALFTSVVRSCGSGCVPVLLTGMGDDGVDGMLALRQAGATTIAQDEDSSVVYGMPREAARRGAATEVLPLQRIAARLVELSSS